MLRRSKVSQDYRLGELIHTGQHYALLEHTANLCNGGVAVEFGVGKGESTRILAQRMPVIGFDAWLGLPTDWRPGFPKGSFAANPPTIDNVEFVDGWFEDTLPEYDFTNLDIGLVHIDCDLYSSTATALKYVGPHLLPGAFIIFDEWHGYPDCENDEQQAWRDYAEPRSIAWTVIGHGEQSWSIQLT